MELRLYPAQSNKYPLQAIHIKGLSVDCWLREIQYMGLKLNDISTYPLPGMELNSISGCLVILHKTASDIDIRNNMWCQRIGNQLYIPHYTELQPCIFVEEANQLFANYPHFSHPELGLVELTEQVDWADYISMHEEQALVQTKPTKAPFIPDTISHFRISVVEQNTIEKQLEDIEQKANVDKLKDKPLNRTEKIKLFIYKKLINDIDSFDSKEHESSSPMLLKYSSLISSAFRNKNKQADGKDWGDLLLEDYKDLTHRNKSQLDKLLELLKDDPEKALDYAIPLDGEGLSRGRDLGAFQLSKFANDLSSLSKLLKNSQTSGGRGYYTIEDDGLSILRQQYRGGADSLIADEKYLQASYIYIKLLKDNYAAAIMFENAKLYKEAGDVYQKLILDNLKAGECYEKAKLYDEAIEMYKTKDMYEKVGDLYFLLNQREEANIYYEKEIDRYISNCQYIKASEIYSNKTLDQNCAQSVLLRGWTEFVDPHNCLAKYLSNIDKIKDRGKEIKRIFEEDITSKNREVFLSVLQKEYDQTEALREITKDIAYHIVAEILPQNKYIANELLVFNKNDSQLIKDTIRYKLSN